MGRRRLDGRLPDEDIAKAFRFIVEQAVQEKADVFLLAGDLFDRPQVEPPHLRQAQEILQLLKAARIPVIAIEGNHDRHFVNTDVPTWVKFLAEDDLLILLRPEFSAEGARLEQWNPQTRTGAWLEIGGIRFIGAGYLGAATPNKIRQILLQMKASGAPQVLLLHAGPEYFVGEGGGFSQEELKSIKEKVCYLALGHIHKPMVHGGWACNPGSPENCDLREAGYSQKDGKPIGRGYAVLEINPGQPEKPVALEVRSNPRRPCLRVELDCTPFGNKIKNGEAALVAAAAEAVQKLKPDASAVVELMLTGNLNLNRIALDQAKSAQEIAERAKVFAVSIDTSHLNIGVGLTPGSSATGDQMPRDQLERQSILQLVAEQPLWGLQEEQQAFADLFYEIKEQVRKGETGEAIASRIATSPLVGKIQASAMAADSSAAGAASERQAATTEEAL